MMSDIRESDWKLLRGLKDVALGRFCQRVLDEIAQVSADRGKTPHERYLAVYELVRRRDRELADTFNGLRRSTGLVQLARMVAQGLLAEEEKDRFGAETMDRVKGIMAGRGVD